MLGRIVELCQREATALRLFQHQHERIECALDSVNRAGDDSKVGGLPGDRGRPHIETGSRSGLGWSARCLHTVRSAAAQASGARQPSAQHRPSCAGMGYGGGVIALFPILGDGEKTCESQVGRGLSACEKTVACQGDTFDAMVEVHTTIIALTRSPLYDPSYAYQSPVDNHPPALSRAAVGLFGARGEAD